MGIETIGTPGLWLAFTTIVAVCLAVDLGVFQRDLHVVGNREAAAWSVFWISLALAFNVFVLYRFGSEVGLQFLTGFLIEKALSVDNLFVFLMIFSAFAVPKNLHHRVLFWGIIGAFVLRAVFIGLGAALVQNFAWILYLFGAFLVYTGIQLARGAEEEVHPDQNLLVRGLRRVMPVTQHYEGGRFFVRRDGVLHATPLLVVLVAVEASDVMFAVDSIPAIFAITDDPFIVYTSNVFAILGLRALYFLLANVMDRFAHLRTGLAGVLIFVGVKMLIADLYHVPVGVSLAVVATLIGGSIVYSIRVREHGKGDA